MSSDNQKKGAFVLDPRTLLSKDFEALVIDQLRRTYFDRTSETERHPTHPEESKDEEARAMDSQRLEKVRETGAMLSTFVKESMTVDGLVDWSKLTTMIRQKLPLFDSRVIDASIMDVFKNPSKIMDLASLKQLKEKGKLIFVFGNESGPVEEQINLMIKRELLKTEKGENKPEEIGIGNLSLKDAIKDNEVLIIDTKERGSAGRAEKVTRVTDVLEGLGQKGIKPNTIVVDTELSLLATVKDRSKDQRLKEGKRLFRIGPENSQTIPYGITRADSLAQFLISPNRPEGQAPAIGINQAK